MSTKKHNVPDALLAGHKKPKELIGENGPLKQQSCCWLSTSATASIQFEERIF